MRDKFEHYKRFLLFICIFEFSFVPFQFAKEGAMVDCIVAKVGEEAITLHETLIRASLWKGRVVGRNEINIIKNTIDKLINQKIIIYESKRFSELKVDEVNLEKTRAIILKTLRSKENLHRLLKKLNVRIDEYDEIVMEETIVREFIKEKFVPFVFVTPDEVQKFYRYEVLKYSFTPNNTPPLSTIEHQIRNIIKEKKINKALFDWLLRRKRSMDVKVLFPCK